MWFQKYLQLFIDNQYRRPSGVAGLWFGRKMLVQHQPENLWTINLVDPQPADCILEIGFGPGFAIEAIARQITTGMVAGLDYSRVMVKTAKRRNASAVREGRVDLRYGDAAQLPFPADSFDKAFSINSLYFWKEPERAMQEIWRVLKPGGIVIMTLVPIERWSEAWGTPVETPTFKPYSQAALAKLLENTGFTDLTIEADPDLDHRSNFSMIGYKSEQAV